METQPLSAADVGAVVDNKLGNGYGCYGDSFGMAGGAWIWVILIFAIFGFGGNGFGRNGNALTQAEMQQGFDTQSTLRKLDGINYGLTDGFYAQNTTMLQGQNQLARDLCQGFAATNSAISENRFAAQQCCCETNRNIDAVRYENAKNTCDIVNAINADGEKTRALMTANEIQALRDKIAEQGQAIQTANFNLSQVAQTSNIVNALRPTPIPAYLTCSPYQSSYYAYNGVNSCSGCNGNFA